jgi:hypothetical protein
LHLDNIFLGEAMNERPRRRTASRLFVGAALAAVAISVSAIALFPPVDRTDVAPSPGASSVGSPSSPASASPVSSGSPAASGAPVVRASGPLGAANDAVIVQVAGDTERPEAIEVSLVTLDAGAFETQLQPRLIARLPGSAIPEGLILNVARASYAQDGWLALDVVDATTLERSILIFDLRAPGDAPWLFPASLRTGSWGPRSVLAVPGQGEIRLYDPNGKTTGSAPVPTGVIIGDTTDEGIVPPTWLADGSGFLAWQGGTVRQLGRLDLGGDFLPATEPPAVFQSTGRERRWAANGTELSIGCPTEGGPPGCTVFSGVNGGEAEIWYTETSGNGSIQDYGWDAEGDGMWFLLGRVTGEGPMTVALAHAEVPGELVDVVVRTLQQPGDDGFEMLGIQDAAPILDGRHVLIGPKGANVQIAVSGDGSVASFPDDTWFSGWAADQGPYPAR